LIKYCPVAERYSVHIYLKSDDDVAPLLLGRSGTDSTDESRMGTHVHMNDTCIHPVVFSTFQMALEVHPFQMALEVHPFQMALEVHTFQMALEVYTFQMALEVHTFQMALEVHTFQMAMEVHTFQMALEVHTKDP
jgi:hypothetical protein